MPAFSWKITCRTPEEAQALWQWLDGRIDLNRVIASTVHSFPDGVEQVRTIPHRLGDYFADILLLPDAQTSSSSFRLVFHRRAEAARFWKDLMASILGEVKTASQEASIQLNAKGEIEAITRVQGPA